MAHSPEYIQWQKDRSVIAEKLKQLLDETGTLLLEEGAIDESEVMVAWDVHGHYHKSKGGLGLVRLQAYPGFSTEEQAYVAARNNFGDGELIQVELPFAPEPIAEFVVERFEPVIA